MEVKFQNFNPKLTQHYYHFVLINYNEKKVIEDFLNNYKNCRKVKAENYDIDYVEYVVNHYQIISTLEYTRGNILNKISNLSDGKGPYIYDIFGIRVKIKSKKYYVIAFPFIVLGKSIIEELLKIRKSVNELSFQFQKIQVSDLIKSMEITNDYIKNDYYSNIVGFRLTIIDDPSISTLSMGGDSPLRSVIYNDYLKEQIEKRNFIPNLCVQKCEMSWPYSSILNDIPKKIIRARIHMDNFGNFKFYMHLEGKNLNVIPHLIYSLLESGCLKFVSINPLDRLEEEESATITTIS